MDFELTPAQREAFDHMLTHVSQCSQTRTQFEQSGQKIDAALYRYIWRQIGDFGVLGLSVPTQYGGSGYGALDTAVRLQAFGQGCIDSGLMFAACAHLLACAMPIAEFGGPELKQRFLPGMCSGELIAGNAITEEHAGSDIAHLDVTATAVDGGWLLDGHKSFVTNGPIADLLVTYATTDRTAGHLGLTAFAIDTTTDGVLRAEPFTKMGLDSAWAGPVQFQRCFIPTAHVLGEVGQGSAVFAHSMLWERACLFAGFLGTLDRIQLQCQTRARTRRQFGRPIAEFQAISHRIVDMKLRLEAARLLLYRACWELDHHPHPHLHIALSKLAVSECAVANALDAVQIHGGLGYLKEGGIEVALRDMVATRIFSGTSEIQRLIAAQELGL